ARCRSGRSKSSNSSSTCCGSLPTPSCWLAPTSRLKTVTTSVNPADIYALARHYRFQWEEAQQCYVLLFPEGMIKLNGGAGEVIKRVDGNKSVEQVVQELEA